MVMLFFASLKNSYLASKHNSNVISVPRGSAHHFIILFDLNTTPWQSLLLHAFTCFSSPLNFALAMGKGYILLTLHSMQLAQCLIFNRALRIYF